MKRSLLLLAAAATLLFQAGCETTPTVNQDAVPDFDPANYSSFVLLQRQAGASGSGRPASPSLIRAVRDTATQTLTRKGMKEADMQTADLAFQITGGSMPRVDVNHFGFTTTTRRSWRYSYASTASVDTFTEGTLVVNAFDTKTKELVWQGYSTRRTNRSSFSDEVVLETLQAVLDAFPSRPFLSSGP